MERIHLTQAVIVEGKYDKAKLEQIVDGLILSTDGFRIFRDRQMRAFIRELARTRGIILLTDSDAAGFRIRAYLADLARDGQVTQVYIPDVFGKERRKTSPGKEGKLGVEGMDRQTLLDAFAQAGVLAGEAAPGNGITRELLYDLGLTGGEGSSQVRRSLLRRLGLPERLSTSALLPVLDRKVTPEELAAHVHQIREEQ